MQQKALTLSVIILAFNEEDHLPACLDAMAAQTVMPDEVIVVDNNSTDNTAAIARSYPFVKLVTESRQGMIPARNKGFSVTTGDTVARIDADACVTPDWAERLRMQFLRPEVMAVSGVSKSYILPNVYIYSRLWSAGYLWWMRMQFNVPILWGTNMTLRRSAWEIIKDELQTEDSLVHEDQDISVLLAKHRLHAVIDHKCVVQTACQDKVEWPKYSEYIQRTFRTLRLHHRQGSFRTAKRLYAWPRRVAFFAAFVPVKLAFLVGGVLVATATMQVRQVIATLRLYGETWE
jgi:glycosyltransferase involved in cell wall biosynthesis